MLKLSIFLFTVGKHDDIQSRVDGMAEWLHPN